MNRLSSIRTVAIVHSTKKRKESREQSSLRTSGVKSCNITTKRLSQITLESPHQSLSVK